MYNQFKLIFFIVTIFALMGCLSQQSASDAIGSGYVAIETLADQVADSQILTAEQRINARDNLQTAKNHLDAATDLYEIGAVSESNRRLQMAVVLLQVVEEILRNVES